MNRKQLNQLEYWFSKPNRKPLVIRGARQVGKSTLVRMFSEQQNLPLAEINLERYSDLGSSFNRNDPVSLVDVLEALPGINAIAHNSLLFLDEIQAERLFLLKSRLALLAA